MFKYIYIEVYMNRKQLVACMLLGTFFFSPTWAAVYKCNNGGKVTYTGAPTKGCVQMSGNKATVSVISGGANTSKSGGVGSDNEPRNTPQTKSAAQKDLEAAQKQLTEERNVRNGNERNYAKYQERIRALEDDVRAKQEAVNKEQN